MSLRDWLRSWVGDDPNPEYSGLDIRDGRKHPRGCKSCGFVPAAPNERVVGRCYPGMHGIALVDDDPEPSGEVPALSQADIDRMAIGQVPEPTHDQLERIMRDIQALPDRPQVSVDEHADQMIAAIRPAGYGPFTSEDIARAMRWSMTGSERGGIGVNLALTAEVDR